MELLQRQYSDIVTVRAVVRSPKGANTVRDHLATAGLPPCEVRCFFWGFFLLRLFKKNHLPLV